jgi:hypothetical protein
MEILGIGIVIGTVTLLGKFLLIVLPYAALAAIFQKDKEKNL